MRLVFRMEYNGFRSEVSDFIYAIPDGWIISGKLALPAGKKISRKKTLPNAGYLFSRHYPFPMVVTESESQKDRDSDLGLLMSRIAPGDLGSKPDRDWETTIPGFVEWIEYGQGCALSLLAVKSNIFDWYRNGYEGTIIATSFVDPPENMSKIAEVKFHLTDDMRRITIELEFFPPLGSTDSIVPIIGALKHNHWILVEPSGP